MDSLLKELFGGADEEATATKAAPEASAAPTDREAEKAQREARREARKQRKADPERRGKRDDFFQRYTTGKPDEGFTAEEAIEHLAELRDELGPAEFQLAMVQTLDNLPIDQRDEFIALMRKHKEAAGAAAQDTAARADAAAKAEAPAAAPAASPAPAGTAPAADPFGGLLTGLFGGSTAAAPSAAGAGIPNVNDVLTDLRSGGLHAPATGSGGQPTADDFLTLLNSPLGKAVLGGLAAYGMQAAQKSDDETLDGRP